MSEQYPIMERPIIRLQLYALSLLCFFGILLLSHPVRAQTRERQYGRFSVGVEGGVRISVGNRTTGRITINGWDRNVIEARAVSTRGDEVVIVNRSEESGIKKFFFKADFADLDQPAAPNARLDSPPEVDGKSVKVHLELNVPRRTEIELIEVWSSDVAISDVETPIVVSGAWSTIILKRVGAADVRTRSGTVEIDGVSGLASVVTGSGAIRVSNSKSVIHAVSITGPIDVKCSAGRVDVSNTEAPIELSSIDGDVDAIATNSNIRFKGGVRDEHRYYLKSMSGRVEMMLPASTHGFNAILSSYRGTVETDFKLNTKQSSAHGTPNRRLVGRFGNGKAQITLDSFEGLVRLTRLDNSAISVCQ